MPSMNPRLPSPLIQCGSFKLGAAPVPTPFSPWHGVHIPRPVPRGRPLKTLSPSAISLGVIFAESIATLVAVSANGIERLVSLCSDAAWLGPHPSPISRTNALSSAATPSLPAIRLSSLGGDGRQARAREIHTPDRARIHRAFKSHERGRTRGD